MKLYVIEVTDYYGYPIERTGIFGIYSSKELAEQALIKDGAVCEDGYWTYPSTKHKPSTAYISEFVLDKSIR